MTRIAVLLLVLLCGAGHARGEDLLDLIPAAALEAAPAAEPQASAGLASRSVDLALYLQSWRDQAVTGLPADSNPAGGSVARLNLRGRKEGSAWSVHWNSRLQLRYRNDEGFQPEDELRLLVKEAYLTHVAKTLFVDGGRLNPRYGVAAGFNPTDFYRVNAAVAQDNADPASQRNDRLGTLALGLTQLWRDRAATLIVSPELTIDEDSSRRR